MFANQRPYVFLVSASNHAAANGAFLMSGNQTRRLAIELQALMVIAKD